MNIQNITTSMSEWKEIHLGDVIQFNPQESLQKGTIAKKVAMEKIQPFTRCILDYETALFNGGSKFRNGDTIMARITPCLENGKTAQVNILNHDEVGFGSTEFIVMRNVENISDKDFIYYLAISPDIRNIAIKSMVGSSGRQRVQQDVLENVIIDFPPLPIQRAISATLSCLDDKIELNNRINANLEAQAHAIFKSWFVDFEPFRGGEFVDSELGKIPKGWRVGTLGEIIELFDSKRIPLSGNERDKMEKIYPYYGAAALMDYVDNYLFDGIYLLLGEDGTVIDDFGFPILQYVWGKLWVNNHAHVIQGRNGWIVESLYTLLKQTNIKAIVTGAVQQKTNQANLKSLKVILPPISNLNEYNEFILPLFAQIRVNSEQSRTLAAIRDILLPRLMSGEIEVGEISEAADNVGETRGSI